MSRVLISFVGSHDPVSAGNGLPGAILSLSQHFESRNEPLDRVVLLWTPGHNRRFVVPGQEAPAVRRLPSMKLQCRLTRKTLLENATQQGRELRVDAVPLRVNAASFTEVLGAATEALKRVDLRAEDDVRANITSGTPMMAAVLTFLIDNRVLRATAWQCFDPAYVPVGLERVQQVNLSHLQEPRQAHAAANLLKAMAFDDAGRALKELAANSVFAGRRHAALQWARLMGVYGAWDRAQWEEAQSGLEMVLKDPFFPTLPGECQELLQQQFLVLEEIVGSLGRPNDTLTILLDIYASLSRRIAAGNLVNTGTRTRRIAQGAAGYVLGVGRQSVPHGGAGSTIDLLITYLNNGRGILLSAVRSAWQVEAQAFSFTRQHAEGLRSDWKTVDQDVNWSVEIHGSRRPDKNKANSFLNVAQRLLLRLCSPVTFPKPAFPASEDLCFGSARLRSLAEMMEQSL